MDVKALRDEEGRLIYKVTSPKFLNTFLIRKTEDGSPFYQIVNEEGGQVNTSLTGRFTSPFVALQTLKSFLEVTKESLAARRDRVYAENHPEKVNASRSGKKG